MQETCIKREYSKTVSLDGLAVPADINEVVFDGFVNEEWRVLADSEPAFGQAAASATVFLEEEDALEAGSFKVTNVFEVGGEAYLKIFGQDALDQIVLPQAVLHGGRSRAIHSFANRTRPCAIRTGGRSNSGIAICLHVA